MVKALRFTKKENTVDLIPYVTVELWYIPRADTRSNHLKQRDRIIHPTDQYEFPGPEKKYKSAAAPWSVFSPAPPPNQEKGKGGTRVSRKTTWTFLLTDTPLGSKFCMAAVLRSMLLKVRKGRWWGLGIYYFFFAWSLFGVLQKMLLFVRKCGKKEKSRPVSLCPSGKMRIHFKYLACLLFCFKLLKFVYFSWTPNTYQTW